MIQEQAYYVMACAMWFCIRVEIAETTQKMKFSSFSKFDKIRSYCWFGHIYWGKT